MGNFTKTPAYQGNWRSRLRVLLPRKLLTDITRVAIYSFPSWQNPKANQDRFPPGLSLYLKIDHQIHRQRATLLVSLLSSCSRHRQLVVNLITARTRTFLFWYPVRMRKTLEWERRQASKDVRMRKCNPGRGILHSHFHFSRVLIILDLKITFDFETRTLWELYVSSFPLLPFTVSC